MSQEISTLVDTFAIRSFRETADKDYINARMAYRARLIQPFRWGALHSLEKYMKCILLLNRIASTSIQHNVSTGIKMMADQGEFALDISATTIKFIKRLEDSGADDRYYLLPYHNEECDLLLLDQAVWELRRYCRPLGRDLGGKQGIDANRLSQELERIHQAKKDFEKGTCITGGFLEEVIDKKKHPAREALIWNNLKFGSSRRTRVKIKTYWEQGNSLLLLNPELLEELNRYVVVPKKIKKSLQHYTATTGKKTKTVTKAIKPAAS